MVWPNFNCLIVHLSIWCLLVGVAWEGLWWDSGEIKESLCAATHWGPLRWWYSFTENVVFIWGIRNVCNIFHLMVIVFDQKEMCRCSSLLNCQNEPKNYQNNWLFIINNDSYSKDTSDLFFKIFSE